MLNIFNQIFRKFSNHRGQHISEYSLLIVSVMAGILIAGPYVVRSWNALLKSYDTDMRDSFTDPLIQAPPENNVTCECGDWKWGECNVTFGLTNPVTCPRLYRLQYHECNPFACDPNPGRCVYDATCCKWQDVGCGGTGITGAGVTVTCPSSEMLQQKNCSESNDPGAQDFQCLPNHPMCGVCLHGPGDPIYQPYFPWKEQLCEGDMDGVDAAHPPRPFYRVDTCTEADKCEVLCNAEHGFVPSHDLPGGLSSTCQCLPGVEEVQICNPECHTECGCPIGYDGISDKWYADETEGDGKWNQWRGGNCPQGQVVRGINTYNQDGTLKGKGGHNWWWFTCRIMDPGCFTGESSTSEAFYIAMCQVPGAPSLIVGADCPPGQVMTGLWSINSDYENGPNLQKGKVNGGENWYRIDCQGVKKECVGAQKYDGYADRFMEWTKKPGVSQVSKTCFATGIRTESLTTQPKGCDGGHNDWWLISDYK